MKPDSPAQSYRFLRKFLPKTLQPMLRGMRKRAIRPSTLDEPYYSVFPFTQSHLTRQKNLVRLAEKIEVDGVPGAIVECGVLDGGTAALMAFATKGSGRAVHLFDSWEGLPEITAEDGDAGAWVGEVVGSPKRVVSIMKQLNIDDMRIRYHKGWFADTFSKAEIDKIALLHVDGDFYESVRLSLETWLPKMASGGYIQLDDYEVFAGCTKAVDELLRKHQSLVLESVTEDYATAYYIRT